VVIATNNDWGTAVGTTTVTAATFASVGAFALPAGSKDAAILTNLPPGNYTAQMSSATGVTGLGLVELYEMDSTGTLSNLSTTGPIAANGVMIAGLVIAPGSGVRKLLVRAAGPALAALGIPGSLADPALTLTDAKTGKTTFASNDNWGTPVGATALDSATLTTIASLGGAFPFPAGSKDAMAYVELAAGSYTVQVTGTGPGGLATVEVYDLTPTTPPTITVAATKAAADGSGSNNGEFTLTRAGDVRAPLTVSYTTGGSAGNGSDYALLPGSVTFPPGVTSVKIPLTPYPSVVNGGTKTATLTLATDPSITVGAQSSATVSIAYVPATLYLATLRPSGSATGSTASGTATILLSASKTLASVTVSFSTLSSTEVTAHLTLGTNQDFVFNLPQGQVSSAAWTLTPTGNYSSADLVNALQSGNISVRIDSSKYPTGEVLGSFVQATGVQTFTPPAAAPAVSLTNVTAADAARLLTQATFGPKRSEIDALTGQSIDTWINGQLAMPFTSHRAAMLADQATYGGSGSFTNWNALYAGNRQAAWWKNALTAPDQLRQRVAFALSELFVISDISLGNDSQAEPIAAYYDLLGNGAFGSFRTLLENVTLNPMMGNYLTWIRNPKGDPTTGQTPDENYAREVMQLFTIGLDMLNPDGTLQLDATGLPIPTYYQATVTEMAKVFTGWSYSGTTNFFTGGGSVTSMTTPMILFPAYHDNSAKNLNLASLAVIPANSAATSGTTDLKAALDALAFHPNTGPFVCKQLIQRLVTSNPSPGYIYRVVQVWQNDGSGNVGNLGAVVRAILEDYEARSPTIAANATYGKLREPILRATALLRSFSASSTSGRYVGSQVTGTTPLPADASLITSLNGATRYDNVQTNLDQSSERSPTVFNFFHPGYVLPGAIASAGLVAPEFEITDATFSIDVPNFLRGIVFATATGTGAAYTVLPNFATEQTLAATPSALLDHLSLVMCAGNLSATTRARVTTALLALPASTTALEKAQTAVLLLSTASDGATQK